jgi:DNA polymerase-3 subunit chi
MGSPRHCGYGVEVWQGKRCYGPSDTIADTIHYKTGGEDTPRPNIRGMTEIDFYSGGDRLQIACRLVAKAIRLGLKVLIYSSDVAMVDRIDKLLWTFAPTDFVPHCRADDRLADVTPVILSHHAKNLAHDEVLVNLDVDTPAFFSRFHRLIEITGTTPEDTQAARKRYRFYQDRGYEIRHHKLGAV